MCVVFNTPFCKCVYCVSRRAEARGCYMKLTTISKRNGRRPSSSAGRGPKVRPLAWHLDLVIHIMYCIWKSLFRWVVIIYAYHSILHRYFFLHIFHYIHYPEKQNTHVFAILDLMEVSWLSLLEVPWFLWILGKCKVRSPSLKLSVTI